MQDFLALEIPQNREKLSALHSGMVVGVCKQGLKDHILVGACHKSIFCSNAPKTKPNLKFFGSDLVPIWPVIV